MPYDEVMKKFKQRRLHSGSKTGPVVTNPQQAVAIEESEKRAAGRGNEEYQPAKKKTLSRRMMEAMHGRD